MRSKGLILYDLVEYRVFFSLQFFFIYITTFYITDLKTQRCFLLKAICQYKKKYKTEQIMSHLILKRIKMCVFLL